jgi:hypothetical protein
VTYFLLIYIYLKIQFPKKTATPKPTAAPAKRAKKPEDLINTPLFKFPPHKIGNQRNPFSGNS